MSSNSLMYVAGFERGVRPIGDWSMAISLSRCSSPSIRSCLPGVAFAAVEIAAQGFDQNVVDQRALARAGHAGDADERAQRNLDVDVLEIVVLGADDPQPACRRSARRLAGTSIVRLPDRYWPVRLRGALGDRVGVAGGHDFAAAHARAGAEVDDVVGRPHRVFVVLDDDHGVAQVAQLRERVEQPVVVARVQADRGLVENVEHADQAAADLPGQANALRLAARERRGGAVERQIVEPHVAQEAQPAADFLEHFAGDQRAAWRRAPAR